MDTIKLNMLIMIAIIDVIKLTCLYSPSCFIKLSVLSIAAFVSKSSVLI